VADLLCPLVIARNSELATLIDCMDKAEAGAGGVIALVGEAGIGKSRLVRETVRIASGRRLLVLIGRAVPGPAPVPFRPLSEALLAATRGSPPPTSPDLAGFGGQLSRLLPDWAGSGGGADESPILIGEAVVRLLRALGRRGRSSACLLVLEDLHWSDHESLSVVEFLGDSLAGESVMCLVTARPDPPGEVHDILERIRRRRSGAVLQVGTLDHDSQRRMIAACLGSASPPAGLVEFMAEHSDGVPFLVEELLAGLASSGALRREGDGWQVDDRLSPSVPARLADSLRRRLAELDPTDRQVLRAAAVLGRRFDWDLLPGIAAVDGSTVVTTLRRAIRAQLISADGPAFRFRHALTREAVLDDMLAPERAVLSRQASTAIARAYPGLPGPWCELAAELAEAGGDSTGASSLLIESARRALRRGALATAAATAETACGVATDQSPERIEAEEVLVRALTAAGQPSRARHIGRHLLDRLPAGWRRRADLHLVLARAAIAEGDYTDAAADVVRARDSADAADPAMDARIEAVAAHVLLEQGQIEQAASSSKLALDAARTAGLPEVECEALEVLGRSTPLINDDWRAFAEHMEEAVRLAERHGLTTWELRARQELAQATVYRGVSQLRQVRSLAERHGALITLTQVDLLLADLALCEFDRDGCLEAARHCVERSRRLHLASLPVALLWLAGGHALAGRQDQMSAVLDEAADIGRDDPRVLGDAWGRVHAVLHAVREDRAELRRAVDTSMPYVRRTQPGRSFFLGGAVWAMLHTLEDDDLGAGARVELAASSMGRIFGGLCELVDAVALGRQGRLDEATATLQKGRTALNCAPVMRYQTAYLLRLAAESAIEEGWGEPAEWLREGEALFADRGLLKIARACRVLLKKAGAPVPRRGRGDSEVPPQLRALGVTSREIDVLKLVIDGLPNREIAARLSLSPRTVEFYVAKLLRSTGASGRADLRNVRLG
jgi:DNA-binding CsgD family transcriptional regulator